MPLTGSLMFVYICIDVGDPVEGRVGMPLTGSLLFVYMYCWLYVGMLTGCLSISVLMLAIQ